MLTKEEIAAIRERVEKARKTNKTERFYALVLSLIDTDAPALLAHIEALEGEIKTLREKAWMYDDLCK